MNKTSRRLAPLQTDERLGPVHISVYLVLLTCSRGKNTWFAIDRSMLMPAARVKGVTTYYRVLRELTEYGYIEYFPTRNCKSRSRVRLP
ncbi:hypothetical protein [Puia sp.]|uniref:hypothetical protein n=1 Tax=Puia sp. TaxID=2045100 RepID=UPI002F4179B1